MRTPKSRIYVELTDHQIEAMVQLFAITGAMSRRELFLNAMAVLGWVVREARAGRKIVSMGNGPRRELVMPMLEDLPKG